MASLFVRMWAWLWAPFERRFGEKWVEPGNAITRAIAAGFAPELLYTVAEPAAVTHVPLVEPSVAAAVVAADAAMADPEPVVPEEHKVRRGRPRRAA